MVVVEERRAAAHFLQQELLVRAAGDVHCSRQSGRRRDVGEHDGARSSIPAMERRLGQPSLRGLHVVRRRLSTRREATTQ